MAGTAKLSVEAQLIPRHYVLQVVASLDAMAMLELAQVLEALDVAEDVAGGFFSTLREQVSEAYAGDRPQPIVVPDVPPLGEVDEDDGGVPA